MVRLQAKLRELYLLTYADRLGGSSPVLQLSGTLSSEGRLPYSEPDHTLPTTDELKMN